MTDEAVPVRAVDQRFMQTLRQRAARELGEGARASAFARSGAGVFPAAESALRRVDVQPHVQRHRRRNVRRCLGNEGACKRLRVVEGVAWKPYEHFKESLDVGHVEQGDQLFVLLRLRANLMPR